MHLGSQTEPHTYFMHENGKQVALEAVLVEKDLGVNVDSNLLFRDHILKQTQKCTKLLNLMRRAFIHLDEESLPLLYKSIIRPHLEYCNVVWHPRFKKDAELIESIQHRD